MDQCFLVGVYELPGGSCAQWFSGFASTSAVIVALTANFYGAWRQAKTDRANDGVEIAGISMILRLILRECDANADLFYDGCKLISAYESEFYISQPLGSVKAHTVSLLTARQADVLIRNEMAEFADKLDLHIGSVNLTNLGIEDYSQQRVKSIPDIRMYFDPKNVGKIDQSTKEHQTIIKDLKILSENAGQFVNRTKSLLQKSVSLAERFNLYYLSNSRFRSYCVDVAHHKTMLKELTIQTAKLEKAP